MQIRVSVASDYSIDHETYVRSYFWVLIEIRLSVSHLSEKIRTGTRWTFRFHSSTCWKTELLGLAQNLPHDDVQFLNQSCVQSPEPIRCLLR